MAENNSNNAPRSFAARSAALVLLMASSLPATADLRASAPTAQDPAAQSDERAGSTLENYCIGGLENRKLIPQSGQVSNPFRQTTVLGCSVDGGIPTIMPDLIPAVRDGKLA